MLGLELFVWRRLQCARRQGKPSQGVLAPKHRAGGAPFPVVDCEHLSLCSYIRIE